MADIWPPEDLVPIYDRMAGWGAWWCGDPDELSEVYGGAGAASIRPPNWPRTRPLNRVSQYRGGLVGWCSRAFWGQPIPEGELRSKLHAPIAGDIAEVSANLLFADPLKVYAADKPTTKALEASMDDGMQATLREAAETGAALGGVYLRNVWDKKIADRPWLAVVQPDCAIPKFRHGRLQSVTFWTVIEADGQKVIRHLESHEKGRIRHRVYVGTDTSLGQLAPLGDYEDTEPFVKQVEDGDSIPTDIDVLTCVYVPNMRPNRIWRTYPPGANLGRSDYSGVEPFMDALDEAWSSWMRDIRLGKARILADRQLLESAGRGQGGYLDLDREVFVPVEILAGSATPQINASQFAIRVQEHQDSCDALMNTIVRGAGYSAQSFGLVGDVAITATEVSARKEQSLQTRTHKITYWRPQLKHALRAHLALQREVFGVKVVEQEPTIEWPPGVAPDLGDVAQAVSLLASAQAASIQTRVEMTHPDWDSTRVKAEVAAIQRETSSPFGTPPPDGGQAALDAAMAGQGTPGA